MKQFKLILFAAAVLVAAACDKTPNDPVIPSESTAATDPVMTELTESTINGTAIADDMTVAGLVSDPNTKQPIPGVYISDGYSWARTDANGVYQIKTHARARRVWMRTPAAYKIGQASDGYPNFFPKKNLTSGKRYRVDFFLEPLDAPETEFTLLAIGYKLRQA